MDNFYLLTLYDIYVYIGIKIVLNTIVRYFKYFKHTKNIYNPDRMKDFESGKKKIKSGIKITYSSRGCLVLTEQLL